MKITIRTKLFLIMFAVIVGFVMSVLLVNGTVLEEYYFKRKQTMLLSAAERTVDYVGTQKDAELFQQSLSSAVVAEEKLGCRILVVKKQGDTVKCLYNSVLPYALDDEQKVYYPVITPQAFLSEHASLFENEERKVVVTEKDSLGAKTLGVYAVHDLGEEGEIFICLRSFYSDIDDSIAIFNRFCVILGILLLFVGAIIVLVIAQLVASPVVSIHRATARMREMDFTTRVPVESTDEVGELAESVNVLSDELEKTIGKLTVANQKLEQDIAFKDRVDEMRRTFISNVSHELKTPLSLIMGYAEALELGADQETQKEYCEIITDESKKMNALVGSILRLSQLESGAQTPVCGRFSVVKLIKETLRSYALTFEEKGITATLLADQDYVVYADYELTMQALGNYLSNAVHYVAGENPTIRVTVGAVQDGVRVTVFNTGEHIPCQQLSLLWDSFYKADKARTRAYGGHGLGLSIVKRAIEVHGKQVGVQNVDGGVEFWLELPTE